MLFEIPTELCVEVVSEWLFRGKDLVNLDTAICNKELRDLFFKILRLDYFVFSGRFECKKKNEKWLKFRKLKLKHLLVADGNFTGKNKYVVTMNGIDISRVEKFEIIRFIDNETLPVKFIYKPNGERVKVGIPSSFCQIINKCPKLKVLDVCATQESFTDFDFLDINNDILNQLLDITFICWAFTNIEGKNNDEKMKQCNKTIKFIVKSCPNLTNIKVSYGYADIEENLNIVDDLILKLPNLQKLIFYNVTYGQSWFDLSPLLNYSKFRHLVISSDGIGNVYVFADMIATLKYLEYNSSNLVVIG